MEYFSLKFYFRAFYEMKAWMILRLDPPNLTHFMRSFKLPIPVLPLGTSSPENITQNTDGKIVKI